MGEQLASEGVTIHTHLYLKGGSSWQPALELHIKIKRPLIIDPLYILS